MSNKIKWASEYKEGDGDVLLKAYRGDIVKRVDEENRTVEFIISTADVDRDNDTIQVAGWDLKSFKKNPVVLFGHDHGGLPIAKAPNVKIEDGKLVSGPTQFPEKGTFPFADTVFEMLKQGFLNSVSAGFIAKQSVMNDERGGVDFQKQELIEFSVVPVPSNPNALVQARSKGIDTMPLAEYYKGILDGWDENKLLIPYKMTRGRMEKCYKKANGKVKAISNPDMEKIADMVKDKIETEEQTVKDERLGLDEHGKIYIKDPIEILHQYDAVIAELKQTNIKLTEMVNIAEELTDRVNRAILKEVPKGAVTNKPELTADAIASMAAKATKKFLS